MKILIKFLLQKNPQIINDLLAAGIREDPIKYLNKSIKNAFISAILIFITFLLIAIKNGSGYFISILMGLIIFFIMLSISMRLPKLKAKKRGKLIDRDILFLGRYIETKLVSGESLINTIYLSTKNYGEASNVMKEIARQVDLGVMIEDAVKHTRDIVPSQKMKLILNQIIEALETGIDITVTLNKVLNRLMKEQEISIKEYGRKLNSLAMMYLMTCVVLPALGFAVFSIAASFMGIPMTKGIVFLILILFTFIQLMFIKVFKSIRPISMI